MSVKVVSSLFDAFAMEANAHILYEATDRHGVTEWAAQLKQDSTETYVTLSMWDVKDHVVGVQVSIGVASEGRKFVQDLPAQVSIKRDYDDLEQVVRDLLGSSRKIDFSKGREVPQLYEYARSPRHGMGTSVRPF